MATLEGVGGGAPATGLDHQAVRRVFEGLRPTASAEHLPPEAVDVALRISKIKDLGTRKKVADAIMVLLQKYFE